MEQDYMPAGGAKELQKSPSGRRYLDKLRKKYELDVLQPSDPKFYKVYGKDIKRREENQSKQETEAQDMRASFREKNVEARKKAKDSSYKKFY